MQKDIKQDIVRMLSLSDKSAVDKLFQEAYDVKLQHVGSKVYFRGIIEISNKCAKNCYYCGIRRGNKKVKRYEMGDDEIIEAALWAYGNNYGSIVLQSGERSDPTFTRRITNLLNILSEKTGGKLGITLSLGEQSKHTYQEWFRAGAHRYLLRIETTDRQLYRKYHPDDHSYRKRLDCLEKLKEAGYQVGTGVLIGLPGQTVEHLAGDILFFRDFDIDMIGMGPFVLHEDTPLAKQASYINHEANLLTTLKMIAAARIVLQDINIASTTALQAINPQGRELGLKAGANIIMPVLTAQKYRSQYLLYQGKPCLDENAVQCRACLEKRINKLGEEIGYNQWGDSPHFKKKQRQKHRK